MKKVKYKPIKLNSPEELIRRIKHFKIKRGVRPSFIITTQETKKALGEWFGLAPKEVERLVGFSIQDIRVFTPEEVMFL